MAKTYKVSKGDTVSEIAEKFGVSTDQVSGYASGDENKIYPGEILSINDSSGEDLQNQAKDTANEELQESAQNQDVVTPGEMPEGSAPEAEGAMENLDISDIETKIADVEQRIADLRERKEQKEKEESQQTLIGQQRQFFGLGEKEGRGEVRVGAREQLEMGEKEQRVDELLQRSVNLNTEIKDIEQQKQTALQENRQRQAPQPLIDKQAQKIRNEHNRRKARKTATLEAVAANAEIAQNQLNRAQNRVDNMVKDATYEEELQYNRMMNFQKLNPQWYETLPKEQRETWEKITGNKKQELEQQREMRKELLNAYTNSGIKIPENHADMSIEDLRMDLNEKVAEGAESIVETSKVTLGDKTYNLTNMQDLIEFRENDGTMAEARQVLDQVEGYTQPTINEMLQEAGYSGAIELEEAKKETRVALEEAAASKGYDGYVLPKHWKAAKKEWNKSWGFKEEDFVTEFSDYIDPSKASEYGEMENSLKGAGKVNRDIIRSVIGKDTLRKAARKAGFTEGGGFLGAGTGEQGANKYLDRLMKQAKAYRQLGNTEEEVFKKVIKSIQQQLD